MVVEIRMVKLKMVNSDGVDGVDVDVNRKFG